MDKVTVIGFKNSGKTCYLAGMYDLMSTGIKNISLVEKNSDQDWYLQKLWEDISDGANRKWPVPSDEKRTYSFSLCQSFEHIRDFEWLDYPGAAIVDPGYGLIDEIKSQISQSSCLLILVNGESFAYEGRPSDRKPIQASSVEEYKEIVKKNFKKNRDLEAFRQLNNLGANGIALPPIAIVVTKCDLIEDEWVDYLPEIIHESFPPIFGANAATERIVMLAAVTLGNDIQFDGDADPVDVELPIAFAVLCCLRKAIIDSRNAKDELQQQLRKKDTTFGRIFNSKEIEALRQKIDSNDKFIKKMSRDAVCLLNPFSDEKPIYINDQQQNFKKYFRSELNI